MNFSPKDLPSDHLKLSSSCYFLWDISITKETHFTSGSIMILWPHTIIWLIKFWNVIYILYLRSHTVTLNCNYGVVVLINANFIEYINWHFQGMLIVFLEHFATACELLVLQIVIISFGLLAYTSEKQHLLIEINTWINRNKQWTQQNRFARLAPQFSSCPFLTVSCESRFQAHCAFAYFEVNSTLEWPW